MRVVIIDDGVESHSFECVSVKESIRIQPNLLIKHNYNVIKNKSHGTVCAAIMSKYEPDIEIVSISILDEEYKGSSAQLIKALEYCEKNRLDIIHLSIGTECYTDFSKIEAIIFRLILKDYIIIAAQSNSGKYTVPANITGVLSVKSDNELFDNQIRLNKDRYKSTIFSASGFQILKDKLGKDYLPVRANSFAAPVVTARVVSFLKTRKYKQSHCRKNELLKYLMGDVYNVCDEPVFFKKTILFSNQHLEIKEMKFICNKIYTLDKIATISISNDTIVSFLSDIDNTIEHEIYKFIKQNAKYIYGILYAGVMPIKIKEMVNHLGLLYWDEKHNLQLQSVIEENGVTEVPIIEVIGNPKDVIRFAKCINKKLDKDGFLSKLVTNIPLGYVYGLEYFSEEDVLNKVLARIARVYDVSCLLLCCEYHIKNIQTEMKIYIHDYNLDVHEDKQILTIPRNYTNAIVSKIYKKIISI